MTIITTAFHHAASRDYHKLYDVMAYSLNKNMPQAKLVNWPVDDLKTHSGKNRSFESNSHKLQAWIDAYDATDDEHIIYSDCDMLFLADISEVFDYEFDLALTRHAGNRIPYNGGIVFVRKSDKAREFLRQWLKVNNRMLSNPDFHWEWRKRRGYAGINQAAMGYMLENHREGMSIIDLPCEIYNSSMPNEWDKVERAKVLHIKSGLRRAVFGQQSGGHGVPKCFRLWKEYETESKQKAKEFATIGV